MWPAALAAWPPRQPILPSPDPREQLQRCNCSPPRQGCERRSRGVRRRFRRCLQRVFAARCVAESRSLVAAGEAPKHGHGARVQARARSASRLGMTGACPCSPAVSSPEGRRAAVPPPLESFYSTFKIRSFVAEELCAACRNQ